MQQAKHRQHGQQESVYAEARRSQDIFNFTPPSPKTGCIYVFLLRDVILPELSLDVLLQQHRTII